ncbi:interleukin-31 receptor subunit alpha-like isoform X2 [Myxocyprinus asiaticus]|uniref:interleukin-31 receptor subunit alpha-like isoform X2 n=1 Tax=Myxocyprinus asiaticus TaxID=70543 RepID=UPI002221B43C|nr:interleukin-31 receptor subunit alpha-like isoform X2 [Myxocyprinus asiaticus]
MLGRMLPFTFDSWRKDSLKVLMVSKSNILPNIFCASWKKQSHKCLEHHEGWMRVTTGCVSTTSPQCYKNSTGKEEDFNCTWVESNPEQNPTYTLHIWDSERKSFIMRMNTGRRAQKYLLLEELGTTSRKMEIWVQRQVGNLTCNSDKTSVILECLVKYSAPQITNMKRSAKKLTLNLTLDKPKDNKSAIYEIRWRERDSEWQTKTFQTEDNTIQDLYTLLLQNQVVYQIQLRRQARLLLHPCNDSIHALWSDWSPMVDVPLEISLKPVIRWVEKQRNGSRDVNLTWDAPPAEESVGGVMYKLNLSVWPCEKPKTFKTIIVNRTFQTSITMSEARVSIIAINKVGNSPLHQIIIPAVKHLNYCPNPPRTNIAKRTCLEWYKLEDGETRPTTVQSSSHKLFKDIENSTEVEKFVRHYYFLHTMTKKHHQTHAMCPFYSEEGVPTKGPEKVSFSDVTHKSAVVRWLSIPVVAQRGFLQQYVIWISEQGNTTHHQVLANETSFLIKNLLPGTSYTVSIAGRTKAGAGPNSTVNFETQSSKALSWQDQTILSVCVVALLCTIICSIAARRFRSKLLPVVPSPVIPATEFSSPHDQDLSNVTEEVHDVILLQVQDLIKPRQKMPTEQSTLLQEFGLVVFEEEEEEDEEEGVSDLGSIKSCCYPNPSYRGQMLQLPEPIHITDNTYKYNDTESTYRTGLFFETRVLECDQTSPKS